MIKGTVKDGQTGGPLPWAHIYISDSIGNLASSQFATTSDLSGQYNLLASGDFITASYTGYQRQTKAISQDQKVDFMLTPAIFNLSEFEIIGERVKKPFINISTPALIFAIVSIIIISLVIYFRS